MSNKRTQLLSTAGEGEGKVSLQFYQRLPSLKALLYVIVLHLLVRLVEDRPTQL